MLTQYRALDPQGFTQLSITLATKLKALATVPSIMAWANLMPDPPTPPPKPKLEAEVLPFPPKLSEQELCRRQALIDKLGEETLPLNES